MPERTSGGLFLPDDAALAMAAPALPAFARPVEPSGDGFRIDAGFASPYLVTDPERWLAELDQPRVRIADHALDTGDLVDDLEAAARDAHAILIVAPALSAAARALLVVNKLRGILFASAIETACGPDLAHYLNGREVATRAISGTRSTLIVA